MFLLEVSLWHRWISIYLHKVWVQINLDILSHWLVFSCWVILGLGFILFYVSFIRGAIWMKVHNLLHSLKEWPIFSIETWWNKYLFFFFFQNATTTIMLVRNRDGINVIPEALAVSSMWDSLKGLRIYIWVDFSSFLLYPFLKHLFCSQPSGVNSCNEKF